MMECLALKRPGKPDTGNPFVRFDEGRSGNTGLTTTVGSTRHFPLRLLYRAQFFKDREPLLFAAGQPLKCFEIFQRLERTAW